MAAVPCFQGWGSQAASSPKGSTLALGKTADGHTVKVRHRFAGQHRDQIVEARIRSRK